MSSPFEETRRQWKYLSVAKQDEFLHQAAGILFEAKEAGICSASTATAERWKAGQAIAVDTLGYRALFRPKAVWLASCIAAISMAFTGMHWALICMSAVVLIIVGTYLSVNQTKMSVVSAAWVDLEAFRKLWDMGLIAIQLKPNGRVFAKPFANTKWQDVILMALGWDELLQEIPFSRDHALNEVLDKVKSAKPS